MSQAFKIKALRFLNYDSFYTLPTWLGEGDSIRHGPMMSPHPLKNCGDLSLQGYTINCEVGSHTDWLGDPDNPYHLRSRGLYTVYMVLLEPGAWKFFRIQKQTDITGLIHAYSLLSLLFDSC